MTRQEVTPTPSTSDFVPKAVTLLTSTCSSGSRPATMSPGAMAGVVMAGRGSLITLDFLPPVRPAGDDVLAQDRVLLLPTINYPFNMTLYSPASQSPPTRFVFHDTTGEDSPIRA